MRSVALDEAHEMLVKKDLKTTVVRPTKEYIDRIRYYYPVRSQALKVLKQQLLLDGINLSENQCCILDTSAHSSRVEENVKCMSECIQMCNNLSYTGECTEGYIVFIRNIPSRITTSGVHLSGRALVIKSFYRLLNHLVV